LNQGFSLVRRFKMSLSSSKQSSQSQLDPDFKQAYLDNLSSTKGVAAGLKPREFAGFNPDQQAAFAVNRQFADPNSEAFAGMRTAFNSAKMASNYAPQQVTPGAISAEGYTATQAQAGQLDRSAVRDVNAERIAAERVSGADVASEALGQIAPQARANIRDVQAGSSLDQNMQQYMSPYTQAVTDQSLKDLNRSRQMQQQQNSAQATAAKAFGGSRQGIVEAETNRAYDENAGRLVAQQNAAAFQNAQQTSQADLARQMQAQQLNQAQDAATTQQSLNLAGQFGLANQASALDAARSNQSTGLQAGIANQGMDFNVGQLNTMNQQNTNLANAAAGNQASQFGASARNQAGTQNAQNFLQANLANQGAGLQANQQRIGASGLLSNIAQSGQDMGFRGANQLAQQGGFQQQFSQQQLDAIRNLPMEQQQLINQALGINVGGGSGMQSSSSGSSFGGSLFGRG
jgi:hypothetical protein